MNADTIVKLIEEMTDLKIQQYAETQIKATPEIKQILTEKRATDLRRLEQIRVEMARLLKETLRG
jgi:hypothetical protein